MDAVQTLPWDRYRVVVLSNVASTGDDLAAKINRFVKDGGTMIATGQTRFRDDNGERREIPVLDCLGIERVTRFRKDTRSTFH